MEKKRVFSMIGLAMIGIILLLGGVFAGTRFRQSSEACLLSSVSTKAAEPEVMTMGQVADYLNMTVDEVSGIIDTEKNILQKNGSFTGKMFPYIIVNDKYYFYKAAVEEWLKDTSGNRRQYDTINKTILQ